MTVIPNMKPIADKLDGEIRKAILVDEARIEKLPTRKLQTLIALGLVVRVGPERSGFGNGWRVWVTPQCCALRDYLTRSEG